MVKLFIHGLSVLVKGVGAMTKRIISCFLAFSIGFFALFAPVQAQEYIGRSNFFTWLSGNSNFMTKLMGHLSGSGCAESDDGRHHAASYVVNRENGYFTCICSYCGDTFIAYERDLNEAYDAYVEEELPASMLLSDLDRDNTLLVQASDEKVVLCNSTKPETASVWADSTGECVGDMLGTVSFDSGGGVYSAQYEHDSSSVLARVGFYHYVSLICPISGLYRIYPRLAYSGDKTIKRGQRDPEVTTLLRYFSSDEDGVGLDIDDSLVSAKQDDVITWFYGGYVGSDYLKKLYVEFYDVYYQVTPYEELLITSTNSDNAYNKTMRPTYATGDYGIIADNGTVTRIGNQSIVNEDNFTVYNPVLDITYNFTNWVYDYSDRSYTVTTESGDEITVTYGDENITIAEGDTTYNVYYLVQSESEATPTGSDGGSGSGSGGGLVPSADSAALAQSISVVRSWGNGFMSAYSGYVGFLTNLFPYLPPDLLALFHWGLAAVVFTGLFRRFFWGG